VSGSSGGTDPTEIRSIAVSAEDVVAALEARLRGGRCTVLRVTPPFSGWMRARLHVEGASRDGPAEGAAASAPVRVQPERLVPDPPPYPDPDETADAVRAAGTYTPETHHDRHVRRVEAWRRAVRRSIVDSVTLETPDGDHEVGVTVLG
jgi:glycerol kinase